MEGVQVRLVEVHLAVVMAAMAVTVAMEAMAAAVHAEPAISVVICGLQILVVNVWEEICAHACK